MIRNYISFPVFDDWRKTQATLDMYGIEGTPSNPGSLDVINSSKIDR
jgi:hypothetical protein